LSVSFIVCAAVTALSAFISLGFSLAAASGAAGAARTLAFYACARSLALAIVSLVSFVNGSMSWLEAVAAAMIIVQACDAVIGVGVKDQMKTFGPAGTALANLAALVWALNA
jgi:hypothetical protein